jgi:hypothetical protein
MTKLLAQHCVTVVLRIAAAKISAKDVPPEYSFAVRGGFQKDILQSADHCVFMYAGVHSLL